MHYVLHSKDDIILARLATDLELIGVKNDILWNARFNQYNQIKPCLYIEVMYRKTTFSFHNHSCDDPTNEYGKWFGRFTVTGKNYNKVLKVIYKALKEETNERH